MARPPIESRLERNFYFFGRQTHKNTCELRWRRLPAVNALARKVMSNGYVCVFVAGQVEESCAGRCTCTDIWCSLRNENWVGHEQIAVSLVGWICRLLFLFRFRDLFLFLNFFAGLLMCMGMQRVGIVVICKLESDMHFDSFEMKKLRMNFHLKVCQLSAVA